MTLPLPLDAWWVLARADLATMAVATGRGVHVTPQAFAWAAGRLWLVAPDDSLKVRSLRRRPVAGAAVTFGGTTVLVSGTADLVDTWPPPAAAAQVLAAGPRLGAGLATYGGRNALRALGITADALTGRMGRIAPRTIVALRPERLAVVRGRSARSVAGTWPGTWPDPDDRGAADIRPGSPGAAPAQLPSTLGRLVQEAATVELGWPSPVGPLVVPATVVDAAQGRLRVPVELARLAGPPRGEGSAMVHRSPGLRPGDYAGVLLRGPLTLGDEADGLVDVHLDTRRVTWWEGYRATTVAA